MNNTWYDFNINKTSYKFILPNNETCSNCFYFDKTCSWLLGRKGNETECDWLPERYKENKKETN